MEAKLRDIDLESQIPGFWDELERAQKVMTEKRRIEKQLGELAELKTLLSDAEEYVLMAEEEGDEELADEAAACMDSFDEKASAMRIRTLLTDEYDKNSAIVSIHSGAGGLDAQDWAEMLLRMYTRWCEGKEYKMELIDLQRDPEAGIKAATLVVEGEYAYGYLKTERGVHRLVRISPYNAAGKRQTSFASVDVTPELPEDVKVEINPEDLRIDTYRSSGAGGQHVNKTDSAVRITHLPTNIVVSCQNERSQIQNKEFAMRVLYSKLLALAKQEHKDKIDELKGNFGQISWGNQIRSYVLQPYTMVKDHRTEEEVSNVQYVLDGGIDSFINASLNAQRKA
ncbi:MAG: peptide chain release factor 2 [Firmicutes bacterium]|nr:peptide chain release factor 2 [Bacillota bacterium]